MPSLNALVTAGPTREWIDPVRFISNASSGKMGYAIAAALQKQGITTTLISGPVMIDPPAGVKMITVESAADMLAAAEKSLPVDIAVCTAAVADWQPETRLPHKQKKQPGQTTWPLSLVRTPDILHALGHHARRPRLVIGFALESDNLVDNGEEKRKTKNADWIFANDVGTLEKDVTRLVRITPRGQTTWPDMKKTEAAEKIVRDILEHFAKESPDDRTYHRPQTA